MPSKLCVTARGTISSAGEAGKDIASFCSPPLRRASYLDYRYRPDDILLFGRESAGVPGEIHDTADARLRIPIREGLRSLNVAIAAALAAGEALRQTGGMPRC